MSQWFENFPDFTVFTHMMIPSHLASDWTKSIHICSSKQCLPQVPQWQTLEKQSLWPSLSQYTSSYKYITKSNNDFLFQI